MGALEADRLKQIAPTMFLARAGDVVERVEPDSRHHRTKCAEFGSIIKCEKWAGPAPDGVDPAR
ncbi:hypothetical protein Vse01_17420 [Micromonospora sediminimaris]|uniref:Uncharacterized protein n=1 Tax=Micromonospora sediminimaris TaxID=547162 RepID=A0A9W5UNA9_9ACTN|nr:hypothetical protein Vse01_17420 [Micromonospora sediminimaris]